MGYFSPKEMIGRYAAAGSAECALSTSRLLLLGVLAGLFIAMGCAVTPDTVGMINAEFINTGLHIMEVRCFPGLYYLNDSL